MSPHLHGPRRLLLALIAAAPLLFLSGCIGAEAADTGFVPSDAQSKLGAEQAWQPELLSGLGDPATSGTGAWPSAFDAAPTAYDLDGDGVDEIIAQADDTDVRVYRAFTGELLATLPTSAPPAWHVQTVLNPVAAGALRPGEPPSLVVTSHAAYVSAWRFDPAASRPDHFVFQQMFDERMDDCHRSPGMDAGATLGDLDGDDGLEIVVQTEERGFYALRADGSTLWSQCWGGGNSAPVVADLDGDGRNEVVVGSDAGFLSVLDGATGRAVWTYDAAEAGITPASITASPTVADLDGVLPLEVLFTARHAPMGGPETYPLDHFAIFAVHQDAATYQAELMWLRQPEWGNPLSATRLVVLDADGDGGADIFGMDWNTIGHYPGDWERLGPAHAFRLDADGNDVWVREMETWWSNQDIALADLDGDGRLSVLLNGPAGPYDGLWRLSADTGAAQSFLPLDGWKMARGPQVFDLRNDGSAQLVFPVVPMDDAPRGAILVFALGPGARGAGLP